MCVFTIFTDGFLLKGSNYDSKQYEGAELEALLVTILCQRQEGVSVTLGLNQQAKCNRSKSLEMIEKLGNWAPYELKRRNVKRGFWNILV